ncbi:MAG: ribosomal protein S18-alanine N-acetyltransferase [Alphaproteobacteria bacterium]|nr:ribosomal protein S18-alanine N-acetyltransferase [Alphaproteobacteria bacterium]
MSDRTALLRPATPDDLDGIAAVEQAAAHAPWPRASVASTLEAPTTRGFVAVQDGDVVGHVLASAVADQGEILTLAVLPTHRRRGLAHALLDAVDVTWRAMAVQTAWLEVRVDNTAARALYAARGWSEHGLRRAYYEDGADALVLSRCP